MPHGAALSQQTPYSTSYDAEFELSEFKIPHDEAPADAVHQMLKDELDLDGRPNLNLASFVGTYMEKEAGESHDRGFVQRNCLTQMSILR